MAGPMKRSRIKQKVSDFELEFQAMKPTVHERSGGMCEAWRFVSDNCDEGLRSWFSSVLRSCGIRATNTHHRKYRSRGGTNSLDNLIDLCYPCHAFIHSQPKIS